MVWDKGFGKWEVWVWQLRSGPIRAETGVRPGDDCGFRVERGLGLEVAGVRELWSDGWLEKGGWIKIRICVGVVATLLVVWVTAKSGLLGICRIELFELREELGVLWLGFGFGLIWCWKDPMERLGGWDLGCWSVLGFGS